MTEPTHPPGIGHVSFYKSTGVAVCEKCGQGVHLIRSNDWRESASQLMEFAIDHLHLKPGKQRK